MASQKKTTNLRTRKTSSETKNRPKKNRSGSTFNPNTWEEVEQGVVSSHVLETTPVPTSEKFPPPSKHPTFVARWNDYVSDVTTRENFKRGHLAQLAILCDLYVEYEKLSQHIDENGMTYRSEGRNGTQYKITPEAQQRNRVVAEIRSYSKHLGLLLVKDKNFKDDEEEKEEWG